MFYFLKKKIGGFIESLTRKEEEKPEPKTDEEEEIFEITDIPEQDEIKKEPLREIKKQAPPVEKPVPPPVKKHVEQEEKPILAEKKHLTEQKIAPPKEKPP